jgi:negative regulator of flagellin synthesis FlgM
MEAGVKIDDSLNGVAAIRNRDTQKKKGNAAASATQPDSAGDSVEITQTSAHLSQLEDALTRIDSSDAGKVEAIRLAIAEGRFQVDEEAVASALVQGTMEQLRRQGKGKG